MRIARSFRPAFRAVFPFAVVASLAGGNLVLSACGSSSDPIAPSDPDAATTPDARAPAELSDADTDGDADAGSTPDADSGVVADRLATDVVAVHGVTTDDHAVFARTTPAGTRTLEAVPIGGGAAITILAALPANHAVAVRGNGVAVWELATADAPTGALSYWTRAGGLVPNAASVSLRDQLWSTTDGARIAFTSGVTFDGAIPMAASVTLAATATHARTEVLADTERLALDRCDHQLGFAGTTLIAAYCSTGGNAGARLVTVPDATTPVRRVLVDGGLRPWWSADDAATKILAIATDQDEGRIVTNTTPPTVTPLETGLTWGLVQHDGSAVAYQASQTLRRATLGVPIGAPTTVATDVRKVLDVSSDQSKVLFHTLEGRPVNAQIPDGERFVDLGVVASDGASAPVTLVPTERALPLALSADGAFALYLVNGPRFNAIAIDGTGERSMPMNFTGLAPTPSGSGAILSRNPRQFGQNQTVVDLELANFTLPVPDGAIGVQQVASDVLSGSLRWGVSSPRRIAFVRPDGAALSLYGRTLP